MSARHAVRLVIATMAMMTRTNALMTATPLRKEVAAVEDLDCALDYDQCPECRNFGIETTECGAADLTFHCPDCGNDWRLPYLDEDDDVEDDWY